MLQLRLVRLLLLPYDLHLKRLQLLLLLLHLLLWQRKLLNKLLLLLHILLLLRLNLPRTSNFNSVVVVSVRHALNNITWHIVSVLVLI